MINFGVDLEGVNMELIKDQIKIIQNVAIKLLGYDISDEKAFSYMILQYYYFNGQKIETIFEEIHDMVTDGTNDGGVDLVYYDEENSKVIIGQSKFTKSLSNNDIIEELNKMSSTVKNFEDGNTGSYNKKLKRELQNAIDRLPEDEIGNVEYCIFTTSQLKEETLNSRIEKENNIYSKDMVNIYQYNDINSKIESILDEVLTVKEANILIDRPKNMLKYRTDITEGIMVNVSSKSLCTIYNQYSEKGLFDMNIRKYIRNKMVDNGIKKTLDDERENFWFLNNGIIIACKDFRPDGNKITLYDFSIVNGGQTTTLIGNYNGKNTEIFYVPCKIICQKNNRDDKNIEFFSKIAEATNSQKPILARDLKSNAPEMKVLKRWLSQEKIFLEIKRGEKCPKGFKHKIKNDELGQLILSFVYQRPGTSRSGKKAIFENKAIYNQIFKNNYTKDSEKKKFIMDLIDLNDRYNVIVDDIKKDSLKDKEKEVVKNGKYIIFALLGVLYNISNNDINESDLMKDARIVKTNNFIYSNIIGNYKKDDLDDKLKMLIIDLVQIVSQSYDNALKKDEITSISNYFKTDKKYIEDILGEFINAYSRTYLGKDLKMIGEIFKRNK